jgi:hypothetical protein
MTTGTTVADLLLINCDHLSHTATVVSLGGLSDGNYRLSVLSTSVTDASGDTLASDFTFNFFVLTGDLNRDGAVGFSDFVTLAQHYGKKGASWSDGDLNRDGTVSFIDLVLLSQNYGRRLPLPAK